MKRFFLNLLCIGTLGLGLSPGPVSGQTLIVNEVSNGPSGNKEYVEMIVVGPTCTTLDLRGWIVDDNNGDFACGPISGVGIAAGHIRFTNNAALSAVPVGSIILIHNDLDVNALVPANDPTDANGDSIYIIPVSNNALLERTSGPNSCPLGGTTQIPLACTTACPGSTGSSAYAPVTYTAGGNNAQISLANSGDAMQTRYPSGAFCHGISYGNVDVTGGPDGMKLLNVTGATRVFSFTDGNFRSSSQWVVGSDDGVAGGDESPGTFNNALNRAYILSLRNCILPVRFSEPLSAVDRQNQVLLSFATGSESQVDGFVVERAGTRNGDNFHRVGYLPTSFPQGGAYSFLDEAPLPGSAYYRIQAVDREGKVQYSNIAYLHQGTSPSLTVQVSPVPAQDWVSFSTNANEDWMVSVYDLHGKRVYLGNGFGDYNTLEVNVAGWDAGMYFWQVEANQTRTTGRLVVQ